MAVGVLNVASRGRANARNAGTVRRRATLSAAAVAAASALAGWATPANAAVKVLASNASTANFADVNFSTPTLGTATAALVSGDSLVFVLGSSPTDSALNDNLTAGSSIAGITYNVGSSAYTIGGNAFNLTAGITNNGTSLQAINDNLTLTAATTITTAANGGNLTLGGTLTGAFNLSSAGTGVLTLSAANTGYTGTTLLTGTGNVVRLSNGSALGTGAINMASGSSVVELTGGITLANNVTTLGGRTTPFLRNLAGTNTYSGTVTQTATGGGTDFESAGGFLNVTGTVTSTQTTRVLYVTGASNGQLTSASTVGTNFNQLTKTGGGTWTLSGAASSLLSGATIVQGGTLAIDNTTGTFGAGGALTFNADGGTFNFIGGTAGTAKTLGALTFTAGRGIVQATNNGGTTGLTFASLAARAAGATADFLTSGGTVGTPGVAGTDKFLFTTAPTTLSTSVIDPGIFFNGASYAAYDATSGVRALAYGTDLGATTTGATTTVAGTNVQVTGGVSDQLTTTLNTLNITGNNAVTLDSSATLTVNGLLQSGNASGGSTITGGVGVQPASGAELVIRTDQVNDALTISTPVLANGTNALTKAGQGTLTLSGADTFTGATTLLNGTLNLTNTNVGALATVVQAGTLNVTGAGSLTGSTTLGTLAVSPVAGGLATVNVNTTGTLQFGAASSVIGGNLAGTTSPNNTVGLPVGILNVQAGTLATGGVAASQRDLQAGNAGFGTINVTGGTVTIGGYMVAGIGTAGAGIWNITGGPVTINPLDNFAGTIGASANATGVVNVTGTGSFTAANTTASGAAGLFVAESGVGTLNVAGSGTVTLGGVATSAGLDVGRNAGTFGVVNLGAVGAGGGLISTDVVRHTSAATGTGIFNFHGGTLQAATGIANTGVGTTTGTAFMAGLTAAYVYGEGGTIDNNSQNITIAQPLLAPVGSGITAIPVATGGTNYATAPIVSLSGGGGVGATAVASVSGGAITGITITNPGTGYSGSPTITLIGGALTGSTPAAFGTPTLTANVSGALTLNGTGTTTLTGVSTYAGATTVNAGTLNLSTGSLAGTAVTVNNALHVLGAYTIGTSGSGSLALAANTGSLSLVDGTLNTLSIANATAGANALTIGGGDTLAFEAGGTTGDQVALGAGLTATASGSNVVNITLLARPTASQTLTLINAPGGFAGSNDFTLGTVSGAASTFGLSFALASTTTQLNLVETAAAAPATAYFVGDLGTSLAANNGTIGNFSTDPAGANRVTQLPGANTDVHFYATNANTSSVAAATLDSAFTIKSLTIDGSTLGESSPVSIAPANASSGVAGTLTITPTVATAGITVNAGAGATTISAPVTLGAAQTFTTNSTSGLTISGTLANGGNALAIAGSGPTVLSGVVSGAGGITSSTTGTLTLSAANTYTGPTNVGSGTVVAANNAALGSSTATTAGLLLNPATGVTATVDFNTSAPAIASLASAGAGVANVVLGNAAAGTATTLTIGGNNLSTTFSGTISDLSATNAAAIGSLDVIGSGTLTLASPNTYTGSTTLGPFAAVVVSATASGALGTGTVIIDTGGNANTSELQLSNNITLANAITLPARTISTTTEIENLSGNNTLGGTLTTIVGGSGYGITSDAGTLTLSNATSIVGFASTKTVNLQGAGNGVVAGTISGTGFSVAKNGAGTWALNATNTYTAGTTITAGTLQANGATSALGTGTTTVTGGVLAGTGATGGPVVINTGGKITAGSGATTADSVGTLTTGAQTWNSGGTFVAKVTTTDGVTVAANDSLVLSGLTVGATSGSPFNVSVASAGTPTLANGSVLILADDTDATSANAFNPTNAAATIAALNLTVTGLQSATGSFALSTQPDAASGYDLILQDVAAPEPTSLLLLGLAAGPMALGRRRSIRAKV